MQELRVVEKDEIIEESSEEVIEEKVTEKVEDSNTFSEKIDVLSDEVDATNKELEKLKSLETRLETEDIVVQEKNWLEERTREQRLAEDIYREELFEKQKMLEEKRKTQTEAFAQNKQMKIYNQMHEDEQNELVFALHGVSTDMMEGMQEYKNALFQGAMIILLLTGAVICGVTAYTVGIKSNLFIACIALFATNTALLPRESFGKLSGGLYNGLCKILCIIPTPVMGVLLVTNSVEPMIYDLIMDWIGAGVVALCLFGALGYCLRNPYRNMRRAVRAAKADIKDLKKTATKTVRKNIKTREKLENKLLKRKEKQENKLENLKKKEQDKVEKLKKREEEKAQKLAAKIQIEKEKQARREEISETRRVNREKNKELYNQKLASFKARFKKNESVNKELGNIETDDSVVDNVTETSDSEKEAI